MSGEGRPWEAHWPPLGPQTLYASGPWPPGTAGSVPLPLPPPEHASDPPPPVYARDPPPFYASLPFYGAQPAGGPLPLYGPLPVGGPPRFLMVPRPGPAPNTAAYGPARPALPPAPAAASTLPPDPFGVSDQPPGQSSRAASLWCLPHMRLLPASPCLALANAAFLLHVPLLPQPPEKASLLRRRHQGWTRPLRLAAVPTRRQLRHGRPEQPRERLAVCRPCTPASRAPAASGCATGWWQATRECPLQVGGGLLACPPAILHSLDQGRLKHAHCAGLELVTCRLFGISRRPRLPDTKRCPLAPAMSCRFAVSWPPAHAAAGAQSHPGGCVRHCGVPAGRAAGSRGGAAAGGPAAALPGWGKSSRVCGEEQWQHAALLPHPPARVLAGCCMPSMCCASSAQLSL